MIEKLQNENIEVAREIHAVFQLSYAVEAKLLKAKDFPPLKRPLQSFQSSENTFFGYLENTELAGVIEVELTDAYLDIHSLVVHPAFFRRGIASQLLAFLLHKYDAELFIVETGLDNKPAIELYKKHGFKEIKHWDTDFGIRKLMLEKRM